MLAIAGVLYVQGQKRLVEQNAREQAADSVENIYESLSEVIRSGRPDSRHPRVTQEMLDTQRGGLFESDTPVPPQELSVAARQCEALLSEENFSEAAAVVMAEDPDTKLASGIPALAMIYFQEAKATGDSFPWKNWQANHWPHPLTDLMADDLGIDDAGFATRVHFLRELQSAAMEDFPGWLKSLDPESGEIRLVSLATIAPVVETGAKKTPFCEVEVRQKDRPVYLQSDITGAGAVFARFGDENLEVIARLTNPDLLFESVNSQTIWTAALILAAVLASVFGVLALNRALRRQQELNALQSDFVASVSHELRTPLASMLLVSGRLAGGKVKEEPKQMEYFDLIQRECRRLGTLVENLLDHARIEQGQKVYSFEETDLEALVSATVSAMAPIADEKGVTLTANITPLKTHPVLDGMEVRQALFNLIDNAIKYSGGRENAAVEIGVRECTGKEGGLIEIVVLDENEIIPQQDREIIFERFYRRGEELHRKATGTGLGLSIVRYVCEAHGGHVRVRSRADEKTGNEFVMTLPVIEPERSEPT